MLPLARYYCAAAPYGQANSKVTFGFSHRSSNSLPAKKAATSSLIRWTWPEKEALLIAEGSLHPWRSGSPNSTNSPGYCPGLSW